MNKNELIDLYYETYDRDSFIKERETRREKEDLLFLSSIYETGNGVDKDIEKAYSFLTNFADEKLCFLLRHKDDKKYDHQTDLLFLLDKKENSSIKEFLISLNEKKSTEETDLYFKAREEMNKDEEKFSLLMDQIFKSYSKEMLNLTYLDDLIIKYIKIYLSKNNPEDSIKFLIEVHNLREDILPGDIYNEVALLYMRKDYLSDDERKNNISLAKKYFFISRDFFNNTDAKKNLENYERLFSTILDDDFLSKQKKERIIKYSLYILTLALIITAVVLIVISNRR